MASKSIKSTKADINIALVLGYCARLLYIPTELEIESLRGQHLTADFSDNL